MSSSEEISAGAPGHLSVTVIGTVQGVGYRPFVHQLASKMGLAGTVRNESGSVRIEVEGAVQKLEEFMARLKSDSPPLARVEEVFYRTGPFSEARGFRIEESQVSAQREVLIPPDVAICEECLAEMRDPGDRRFDYAFLSCVNCGPRFTVIQGVPYDRERTTLRGFRLCASCRKEHDSPGDRRFHAQTLACPKCGPKLTVLNDQARAFTALDPLGIVSLSLEHGLIVAIKGIGGYHLACDARNSAAVRELRRRKRRDEKPLAILVAGFEQALELCEISPQEQALLESPARPIVLLKKRASHGVALEVAFDCPELGVMLAYAPLHHLILDRLGKSGSVPLVMTSANESDQPIVYEDQDARRRLRGVADLILTHDRPIEIRCDDSVARVMPGGIPLWIRRSRGYAPGSIRLSRELPVPVLATGAQLKNTFALGSGTFARLSHHIGDLEDFSGVGSYARDISHYEALFGIRPQAIAHDMHPEYLSTRYARERAARDGIRLVPVQHHHAHLASCLVDSGFSGPVIGVIFDGTGYGTDGKIWGGEFLVGDCAGFERAAHLAYVPMPGGEQAIREPWRMALAHLLHAGCGADQLAPKVPEASLQLVQQMIEKGVNSPLTSSTGRLFDAAAALLGLRMYAKYEAQAAMELEWLAGRSELASGRRGEDAYAFGYAQPAPGAAIEIDPGLLVARIVAEIDAGAPAAAIAQRFHEAIAAMVVEVCSRIRERTGLNDVALSGGVYMNALLFGLCRSWLTQSDFCVHFHRSVPANDGGISLGQLAVAAEILRKE